MNEQRGANVLALVFGALTLALVLAAGMAIWLMGAERLYTLALVLVVGLVLAGLIVAAAVLVRQWRRSDANPVIERHYHHDGTRTIEKVVDYRPAIAPLPAAPLPAALGVFPELLRAAYQAGALPGRSETVDAVSVREVTPGEWGGEIRR